jgi:hypothetical protein
MTPKEGKYMAKLTIYQLRLAAKELGRRGGLAATRNLKTEQLRERGRRGGLAHSFKRGAGCEVKGADHGTVNGYVNQKCRCGRCREAWRSYLEQRRAAHA